jgi:release factor glutamine methyltransferase
VLAWAAEDLRGKGSETPRLDAELLLASVLGTDRIGLIVDPDRPLSKEELAAYRDLHKRRRSAEPVAYMLGVREFYGRPFRVDPRVLVPRPDTEALVETALERLRDRTLQADVLDLCTGSGCVAVTLACERPTWRVLGTDISEGALEVARENASRLGAVPRCWFRRSDLFADLGEAPARFDLVTANPPYVSGADAAELPSTVRDHEPHVALFAGPDGLDVIRRIVAEAPGHLVPGGVLAVEVGAGQAPVVRELFEASGLTGLAVKKDYGGIERVVSGVWPGDGAGQGAE